MRTSASLFLFLSTSIAAADYRVELSGSPTTDPVLLITPDR